jgi:hypothetical protein
VVGQALTALRPTVTGQVDRYTVSPALPAGVVLDPTTGVISGTPTAAAQSTAYVVQASNVGGSSSYTLQFSVGTVDMVSGATVNRTVVAGTAIYFEVVIKPRYLTFTGTLYASAADPDHVLATPVSVTPNSDGSFTLEVSTSNAAAVGTYAGTATLQLCSDASCNTLQAVPSVTANYTLAVRQWVEDWPGDHLTTLTPWRDAPDWQTFQGNAAHTGFVPVTVVPDDLTTRWQRPVDRNVASGLVANLATIATSNGLYYISGANAVQARSEADGSLVWSHDFSNLLFPSANPPAVANGTVYVAAGQQDSTYFYAFDAATGAVRFHAPMASQWENYLAPTVGPLGVYTNAGYFGGAYGFTSAGQPLFFAPLEQQDVWTPAVDTDSVYAYTGYALTVLDASTGQRRGSIADPMGHTAFPEVGGSVVLGGPHSAFAAQYSNSLFTASGVHNSLEHFDTAAMAIDWSVDGVYPRTPAYRDGVVYAVNNSPLQLEARSESNGGLLWTWTPPGVDELGFISEVLLTNTLAFVSTARATYAVDLGTHKAVWSFPVSGNLALSASGILYVEGPASLTAFNAK